MDTTLLKSNALSLHSDLLGRIDLFNRDEELPETKKLEKTVHACALSLHELYMLIPERGFCDLDIEILFFKTLKPLFVSEREFHQRLYHAKLFGEDSAGFWGLELGRMKKLLDDHNEFGSYYHGEETHNDAAWFSHGQAPLPTTLCMWPWETDPRHTSARDGWISGLMAVERYHAWVQARIEQI